MALYSDIIDTNSKWMWSSITTGTIGLLFLSAAFFGLSDSMNSTPILFDSSQNDFILAPPTVAKKPVASTPVEEDKQISAPANLPVKITAIPKIIEPQEITPQPAKPKVHVISRSTKQDASFAHIPVTQPPIAAITPTKEPESTLSKRVLPATQLASLGLKPKDEIVEPPSISVVEPAVFKPVLKHIEVKRGDTLLRILKQNGASTSEAQNIVNELKPHIQVNALELGQPLTLTLERRDTNRDLYPTKLIIPLGYRASKPDTVLKNRITVAYDNKNKLQVTLPSSPVIAMRPSKPIKAPKYTPSQRALNNVATSSLTRKITNITSGAASKQVYYRTFSSVRTSFKSTIAAQNVPKDVQSRLLSVYNQVAKSKNVRSGDTLEVFYDQTENVAGKRLKLGKLLYINFKANGRTYTYYRYGNYFYDKDGNNISPKSISFMSNPVPGAKMTSKFGMRRHPILRTWKMHSGTDLAAPRGTPIYAPASGRLLVAKWQGGLGRHIQIEHENGYVSTYSHMNRFAKGMRKGKFVNRGQIIGYVGTTGLSTGNHLHFEVLKAGKKIDPMKLVGRSGGSNKLAGASLVKFRTEKSRIISKLSGTKSQPKIAKR